MKKTYEKDFQVGGKSVGKIGFTKDFNGNNEFLANNVFLSPIDNLVRQVYGIPFHLKDDHTIYPKYGIQPKHFDIVTDHFRRLFKIRGYQREDFDYGEFQEKRIAQNGEQKAGLEINGLMSYEDFVQKQAEKLGGGQETKEENETVTENKQMMQQMQTMMQEMQKMQQQMSKGGFIPSPEQKNDKPTGSNEGTGQVKEENKASPDKEENTKGSTKSGGKATSAKKSSNTTTNRGGTKEPTTSSNSKGNPKGKSTKKPARKRTRGKN